MRFSFRGLVIGLGLLVAGCQTTIPSAPMQPVPMSSPAPAAPASSGHSHAVPKGPGSSSGPGYWSYTAPPQGRVSGAAPSGAARAQPPDPLPATVAKPVQALPAGTTAPGMKLRKVQLAGPLVPVRRVDAATGAASVQQTATVQPLPPVDDSENTPPPFPRPQEPIPVYPQTPY